MEAYGVPMKGEASVRGSRLHNRQRQEKGMCVDGWVDFFFSFPATSSSCGFTSLDK